MVELNCVPNWYIENNYFMASARTSMEENCLQYCLYGIFIVCKELLSDDVLFSAFLCKLAIKVDQIEIEWNQYTLFEYFHSLISLSPYYNKTLADIYVIRRKRQRPKWTQFPFISLSTVHEEKPQICISKSNFWRLKITSE